jgi:hypothetical protein
MPIGNDTCKSLQPVLDVAEAARVEERLAGDAAGAPVLGDAVVSRDAELAVELRVGQRAQRVLVEDGDAAPDLRLVQLLQRNVLGDAPLPEARAQRLLDRGALAIALGPEDLLPGPGKGKRRRHPRILP